MNKSVYSFVIALIIYFVLRGITYFLKWDHWILNIALIIFSLFLGSFFAQRKYGIIVAKLTHVFKAHTKNTFHCTITVKGDSHSFIGVYYNLMVLSNSELQVLIDAQLNSKEHLDSFWKYVTHDPTNIINPEGYYRITIKHKDEEPIPVGLCKDEKP